jgi:Polyketide cyclase / dehydrase and lipid transport
MCYRYEHLATPAPIRGSRGVLRVHPNEPGSRVEWEAEFEPADPTRATQITAAMTATFQTAGQSLRQRIESLPQPT